MAIPEEKVLRGIYGDAAKEAEARFEKLQGTYEAQFGQEELTCFSAPGRTEIIGNHTDHNGGKILAASITMDTIAVAAKTGDSVVTILSEGYPDPIVVDTDHLEKIPKCQGSLSLVGGMLKAARDEFGYRIGGFNACVSTQVISSAGVSSSASFEMLVCAILNEFFNGGSIDYAHYARIGQYAENRYWDKASGLMDQMACAVGGTIYLDFGGGEVKYEKVDFGFDQLGCDLVIVNTGKGHADLSAEYSSIPEEMRLVAKELGGTNLCDCTEEDLLAKLPEIRSKIGNDRAILRALHYYEECRRVDAAVQALKEGKKEQMLGIIRESGNSSWKWLQNAYVVSDPKEQSIPYALALSELFMKKKGRGVCRLHGGGFAGVIACITAKEDTAEFVEYLSRYLGNENIHVMGIRQKGAITVE